MTVQPGTRRQAFEICCQDCAEQLAPKRLTYQRGSMTVFSALVVLASTGLALVTFVMMGLAVSRNATETAADQAALAGAGRAIAGQQHACQIAQRVANAHNAELISCEVTQLYVRVSVLRPSPPALAALLSRFGLDPAGFVALSHAEQPFLPI